MESAPVSQHARPVQGRTVMLAAGVDLMFVVMFVLIGRRSHDEGLFSLGALNAIWPFVVGLAVGWMLARAWRNPLGVVLPGVVVWVSTVAVGMLLRVISGQGVQLSFVIVASIFTGLFLLGWRFVTYLIIRRASRAS
nr:DUF3054 domain-containing protein [Lysinibacter cavernae]